MEESGGEVEWRREATSGGRDGRQPLVGGVGGEGGGITFGSKLPRVPEVGTYVTSGNTASVVLPLMNRESCKNTQQRLVPLE